MRGFLSIFFRITPGKRPRIHEYLSFQAAVKTDAGTAAAAHTDESKARFVRQPPRTSKSGNLSAAVFAECVGDLH
jgi:hypothetical protein